MPPKVFCVGMHKTGTSSFATFMSRYGYRCLHDTPGSIVKLGLGSDNAGVEGDGRQTDLATIVDPERLRAVVAEYDAFADAPWPPLFRSLDQAFPGSRFVLIVRETDRWMKSVLEHFGGDNTRMRGWIYGYGNPLRHQERYREVYEAHNQAVRSHFAGRPDDFLEVALGDNRAIGEAICRFLRLPGEATEFPVANRAEVRRRPAG